MMLRRIGAVLLLIACFSIGIYIAYQYKKKAESVRTLHGLLLHLQNEITQNRTILSKCFSSFSNYPSQESKTKFVKGTFKEAIFEMHLDKQIAEEYSSFFEGLGCRGIDEERARLDIALNKSKKIFEESERETAGKRRVATTLGFFIGALLFLLLF